MSVWYVDTSAFMKILVDEEHSAALRCSVAPVAMWSSRLLDVEAHRAARRMGIDADAVETTLGSISLLAPSVSTFSIARTVGTAQLRSLDALHLAAALELGPDLGAIVTYDRRLADEGAQVGAVIVTPGLPVKWWRRPDSGREAMTTDQAPPPRRQ